VPIRKSQIRKFLMINPQIANQQIAIFAEGPQIYKKYQIRKFVDLPFAELFCRLPTLAEVDPRLC
jgi:hypothetical protein